MTSDDYMFMTQYCCDDDIDERSDEQRDNDSLVQAVEATIAAIDAMRAYTPRPYSLKSLGATGFLVRNTGTGAVYTLTAAGCDCPDAKFRGRAHTCKHNRVVRELAAV